MMIPKRRDYPREIQVNDEIYQIKFVRKIPGFTRDFVGLCDHEESTIYIRQGQDRLETFRTFIHEVLHAYQEQFGVKISHKAIYQLEVAIAHFLIVNFG
jgi:hypothetical protein